MKFLTLTGLVSSLRMQKTQQSMSMENAPVGVLMDQWKMIQTKLSNGKVTPEVVPIIEEMQLLITDKILPLIASDASKDGTIITEDLKDVTDCDVSKATREAQLIIKQTANSVKKTKLTTCYTEEDSLLATYEENVKVLDVAQKLKVYWCEHADAISIIDHKFTSCQVECDYEEESGADCFTKAENAVINLKGLFEVSDSNWEHASVKCSTYTSDISAALLKESTSQNLYITKVASCKSQNDIYVVEVSNAVSYSKDTCSEYTTCRTDMGAIHDATVANHNSKVADRSNEYKSVKKIECALQTFIDNKELNETMLQACFDDTYPITWVEVVAEAAPAKKSCTPIAHGVIKNQPVNRPAVMFAGEITQSAGNLVKSFENSKDYTFNFSTYFSNVAKTGTSVFEANSEGSPTMTMLHSHKVTKQSSEITYSEDDLGNKINPVFSTPVIIGQVFYHNGQIPRDLTNNLYNVNMDQWNDIKIVQSGETHKLYINNVLQKTFVTVATTSQTSNLFFSQSDYTSLGSESRFGKIVDDVNYETDLVEADVPV